jgi:pimeloyl-ACP methyl ester carboxylesterase
MSMSKSIVLIHGGFVDGSGWKGVYQILKEDGFEVIVVQNPTVSLADDVAATKRAIANARGDVVLLGDSYGGVVVSEAGNEPKVKSLVYITAFAPDIGESVSSLISSSPVGAPVPPILPPVDGFLFLDREKFAASLAADVRPDLAAFIGANNIYLAVLADRDLQMSQLHEVSLGARFASRASLPADDSLRKGCRTPPATTPALRPQHFLPNAQPRMFQGSAESSWPS